MPWKVFYGTEVKQTPHSLESSRVGNLIRVKWSLKNVASKAILCFISIKTKNTSYTKKNKIQNFKLHVGKLCGYFFIVKKCIRWAYWFAGNLNFC